jgi:hypothetical protein
MDINYILRREQISLYNAQHARSSPARFAHRGLARAYGKMLALGAFPPDGEHFAVIGRVTE